MFGEELAVRVAGGLGSRLVQWKIRQKGEVKARTCSVCQAKKLVLYAGGNGQPLKVLENECDIFGALPWGHGEDWHGQGFR